MGHAGNSREERISSDGSKRKAHTQVQQQQVAQPSQQQQWEPGPQQGVKRPKQQQEGLQVQQDQQQGTLEAATLAGKRIWVWWPRDGAHYAGTVEGWDAATGKHSVRYDDGDREVLALSQEKWHLCTPEGNTCPPANPQPMGDAHPQPGLHSTREAVRAVSRSPHAASVEAGGGEASAEVAGASVVAEPSGASMQARTRPAGAAAGGMGDSSKVERQQGHQQQQGLGLADGATCAAAGEEATGGPASSAPEAVGEHPTSRAGASSPPQRHHHQASHHHHHQRLQQQQGHPSTLEVGSVASPLDEAAARRAAHATTEATKRVQQQQQDKEGEKEKEGGAIRQHSSGVPMTQGEADVSPPAGKHLQARAAEPEAVGGSAGPSSCREAQAGGMAQRVAAASQSSQPPAAQPVAQPGAEEDRRNAASASLRQQSATSEPQAGGSALQGQLHAALQPPLQQLANGIQQQQETEWQQPQQQAEAEASVLAKQQLQQHAVTNGLAQQQQKAETIGLAQEQQQARGQQCRPLVRHGSRDQLCAVEGEGWKVLHVNNPPGYEVTCMLMGMQLSDVRVRVWQYGRLLIEGRSTGEVGYGKYWGMPTTRYDIALPGAVVDTSARALMSLHGQLYIRVLARLPAQ